MYKDKKRHIEYMKNYKKERYDFLKANGICTQCGKAKAMEGRTMCPECLDKNKEISEKSRSEASKEQRRKYIAEKRKKCIEEGICRECLKRKATVGLKCLECHVKEIKRNEAKRTKVKRSMRTELGKCYICGAEAELGFKTCPKHHKILAENIKNWDRNNSNHIWRKIQSSEIMKMHYYCK